MACAFVLPALVLREIFILKTTSLTLFLILVRDTSGEL